MLAGKGKITRGQVDEYRARLHGTLDLADFADCDLVIEAVIENMEEKLRLFPALDHIVKPGALLLTNTSSLNVTQMGAVTKRPDKVCGLHFFNPAPVMKLVEVVRTISTSEETIEIVKQFAISLGKTPVIRPFGDPVQRRAIAQAAVALTRPRCNDRRPTRIVPGGPS